MNRIFLVRHAQSEANVNPSLYSKHKDWDIELTEQGKGQAEEAATKILELWYSQYVGEASWMPKEKFHYNLWYSPFKRATETAKLICKGLYVMEPIHLNSTYENPLLVERQWGELRDIVERGEKTEDHFNFFYQPLGGESFMNCYQRVALFHEQLLRKKHHNNIVVAHGEFNKLYLMYLLEWSIEEFNKWKHPLNGEVHMLNQHGNKWELSSLTPLRRKS